MQIGRRFGLTGIATVKKEKKKIQDTRVLRVFVVESPIYRIFHFTKSAIFVAHSIKHYLCRGASLNKR